MLNIAIPLGYTCDAPYGENEREKRMENEIKQPLAICLCSPFVLPQVVEDVFVTFM